jgi:adenine specific DNA methylase Mod
MSPKPISENTLYYGDNLFILREHIPSESIDLIYLDPPFNSNRSYNILFKDESGTESEAQITAFEDTWHWNLEAEHTYNELLTKAPDHVAKMIESLHEFIGTNQMMANLIIMTTRLIELHRVLKPTGSSIATYLGKSRRVARATSDKIKEQICNTVYFHS